MATINIKDRLLRQSTWSSLAIQLGSLAVLLPAYANPLGLAAAACGIVKLFVPEDSATTREAVCKINCDTLSGDGNG